MDTSLSGVHRIKLSGVDRVGGAPWYVIFIAEIQHQVARHKQRYRSRENGRL